MENNKKIITAIMNINSNAKVIVHSKNDDLDKSEIIWLDDTTPISKEDIKTEMDKLWLILIVLFAVAIKISVLVMTFVNHAELKWRSNYQ